MTIIRANLSETQRTAVDQLMAHALAAENYADACAAFRAGADPATLSPKGYSVLTLAARANDVAMAEQVLRAGAPIDRSMGIGNRAEFIYPDKFVDSQPEHRDMLTLLSAWRASIALGHEAGTPGFDQSLASLRQPDSALGTFFKTVNVGGYENSGYNAILSFSPITPAAVGNDNVAAIAFSAFNGNLHHAMPREQIIESHEMRDPEDQVKANRIRPAASTYLETATVTYYDDEQYHDYVRGTLFFSKDGSSLDAFVDDRPRLIVTAALDDAIAEGRHDALRAAIKAGADLYRCCDGGRFTGLFAAVHANNPTAIDIVASEGLPIDGVNFYQRTPLHHAAQGPSPYDDAENAAQLNQGVIQALLKHGADVNAADADQRTSLHLAVMHGNAPAIAALLQAGADTSLRDAHGKTPEDYLRAERDDEVAQVFASFRAQQMLAGGQAPASPAP